MTRPICAWDQWRDGRIIIPLDGSALAEASLPFARALAHQFGSELFLFHQIETRPPASVHGQPHLRGAREAEAYLHQLEHLLGREGINARSQVDAEANVDVAAAIFRTALSQRVDLIVMSAHHPRDPSGRIIGQIAQHALREGGPPTVIRSAGSSRRDVVDIRNVLVPVDFRYDLGEVLAATSALARAFSARITLLHALNDRDRRLIDSMGPRVRLRGRRSGAMDLLLRSQQAARDRLEAICGELGDDLHIDTVLSQRTPGDAIIETARRTTTDLVVLTSHLCRGVSAGSSCALGEQLIAEPNVNVLLFHAGDAD